MGKMFFSDECLELIRSAPLLLSFSLLCLGAVSGKHEFPVYRMQHFDLHGVHFGSRAAAVNMEVRGEGSSMLNRKCVVVRWVGLTPDRFLNLVHKGAGAILILIPQDWKTRGVEALGKEEEQVVKVTPVKEKVKVEEEDEEEEEEEEGEGKENLDLEEVEEEEERAKFINWVEVEEKLMAHEVSIPVYFAVETPELTEIHDKMAASAVSEWSSSVASMLLSAVLGEGFQMVADAGEPKVLENHEVVTFVGKLGGAGIDHELPTVALVTHYDAFGLAPGLSTGPDSNGSGVAAMLELARLFQLLYSDPHTKPSYNLLFVLTGGGHLSYFGTKYFIDDMLEDDDAFLLSKADYTLCLDSIAAINTSHLFIHLSRHPSESSKAYELLQHVNKSSKLFPGLQVSLVHKKVRIGAGEELVSWEHERFSLRRLPAATVSHLPSHVDPRRKAMFNQRSCSQSLVKSVEILAEGIARHMMKLPVDDERTTTPIFSGNLAVRKRYISAWLDHLSNVPRSPQLLGKDHTLLTSLEETLSKYVDEVSKYSHTADKSDPEFVLYSEPSTTMHVYSVKPAVFDLFLALTIAGYTALVYLLVANFTWLLKLLAPLLTMKMKGD